MKLISRKNFVAMAATFVLTVALAGCSSGTASSAASAASAAASSSAAAKTSSTGLRFVTGGQAGTYYGFGQVLANHATNNAGVSISAITSDGSKANVLSIQDGLADLGFCQTDVMTYAYSGTNLFEAAPITNFSTVAALYEEQVQIVTCDPAIKTVADLRGKRVSIGAAASGVYFNAVDVLGAYDITEKDITPTYQSFGDSADSLKNGQIDAAFVVAGAPTTAITDLSTSKQAYLVSIDAAHADKLIEKSPYYVKTVIPAGTYGGIDTPTETVAVSAVILAGNNVSEDDIYKFVSDIYTSAADPTVASTHAKYAELSIEKGAAITSVPYHPGAAKFFKEKGITVASI